MGGTLKKRGTPPIGYFLGRDPASVTPPWPEWQIQAYVAQQAHRAGLTFSAGMEGAAKSKATAGRSKATGQVAGEPDLRFYFAMGRLALVELKTEDGVLTQSQKERFPVLAKLGFPVEVVHAASPVEGWRKIQNYLKSFQEETGNGGF